MKTLARRLWEEPALFLAALAAAVELVLHLLGANAVLQIVTPLLAGAGVRQLVSPTTREDPRDPAIIAPDHVTE
jgi:hypothetical protein